MTVVRRMFNREQDADIIRIRRVHRWAVLFGVVTPLALLFVALLRSRGVMGVWPTFVAVGYEHAFFYGWAGLYAYGLLAYYLPQLLDITITPQTSRRLNRGLALFAVGVLGTVAAFVAMVFVSRAWLVVTALAVAAVAQFVGWALLVYQLVFWQRAFYERFLLTGKVLIVSAIGFLAAHIVFIATMTMIFARGGTIVPAMAILFLRVIPLASLGLGVVTMLIRMVPELFGWRPLDARQIRWMLTMLVSSFAALTALYFVFHQTRSVAFGVMNVTAAAIAFASVSWVLVSLDLFHTRLAPLVNREHVLYVGGSFAWLLISLGVYWVVTLWELLHIDVAATIWSDSVLFGFFAGFIGLGLLGLYLYWSNQLPSSHVHSDRLSGYTFVLINWTLLLRVFVYPLTVTGAWPGSFTFRWILDALMLVSLALISLDVYHGMIGRCLTCTVRGQFPRK